MPDIHPNDIGLATFADVGDVNKLKTAAKNVVDALNEIYSGAGTGSADFGTQIMVDGEDNIIIGANNIVYGNNNLIIGSDNIVVGDNLSIVADSSTNYSYIEGFNFEQVDIDAGAISYYSNSDIEIPIGVGDKVILDVYQTWTNEDYTDNIDSSSGIHIAEIV